MNTNLFLKALAIGAVCSMPLAGANAEEIGEIGVDWLGNDIIVEAVDDPQVKGVTCHIAYFERGLIDRLQQGNWFEDPSNSAIECRQSGDIVLGKIELDKGGEEIFKNGIFLSANTQLAPEHRDDFLGGLTVINGKALTHDGKRQMSRDNAGSKNVANGVPWKDGELYRPMTLARTETTPEGTVNIQLIPYYAWANRGLAYMDVWIPLARSQ